MTQAGEGKIPFLPPSSVLHLVIVLVVALSSDKVYIQTRRFCAPKVREVRTRDDAEKKLVFPCYSDATVLWEPNDSLHRGKLFLKHHLKGEPKYVEFRPSEGPEPEWYGKLQKVWAGMAELYDVSNVFDDEAKDQWEEFWARFPWGGLKDLQPEDLPEFHIPAFPTEPVVAETGEDHQQAVGVLSQAGMDQDGRRRAFFRDGQDLMKYPKAESYVTYGSYLLSGDRYKPAKKKATVQLGKWRRRRRGRRGRRRIAWECHQPPPPSVQPAWSTLSLVSSDCA